MVRDLRLGTAILAVVVVSTVGLPTRAMESIRASNTCGPSADAAAMDELALTGNARNGRNLRLRFHGDSTSAGLFDGLFQQTKGPPCRQIKVDFEEPVLITRVSVIYQLEEAEARRGRCEATARVLAGGVESGRSGPVRLAQPYEFHPLLDVADNLVWAREAIMVALRTTILPDFALVQALARKHE